MAKIITMEIPMEVEIKQEPGEALDLESKIIQMCQENPAGITDKLLQTELPTTDINYRVSVLNRLLSQGKLEILRQGKQLLYRLKDPDAAKKVKGADNEEKLLYQIIEEAGNKGIWIRDIRMKSNLILTQVNKILRNLESKKLIKAVKSVSASKKKVYMLFNLEPDRSVTGGAWYSEQEFEAEFIEILNQQCYRFITQKFTSAKQNTDDPIWCRKTSYASSEEIWKYINELGISKVQLSVEDIEMILNTLIYDGKVEKNVISSTGMRNSKSKDTTNLYRIIEPVVKSAGLMRMPCGVCPVIKDCHEGGAISPSTCNYMKEWLDY